MAQTQQNMNALDIYIKGKNTTFALFGEGEEWTKPTNAQEAERYYEQLELELSPENLTCDGEVFGARLIARRKYFTDAHKVLEKMFGKRPLNV